MAKRVNFSEGQLRSGNVEASFESLTFSNGATMNITSTDGVTIGGASSKIGFFGATPVAQQLEVAITAGGIHAALVNLGLITAPA